MIDELFDNKESNIIDFSVNAMNKWLKMPLDSQIESKLIMRESTLDKNEKEF